MPHIMVDLETLATSPDAVVVSIGAVEFSPCPPPYRGQFNPVLGRKFYRVLSPLEQEQEGRKINEATLEWWQNQTDEARAVLALAANGGMVYRDALLEFTEWCFAEGSDAKQIVLWGNGADFDNVILSSMYTLAGLPPPWMFWNNRCFRSLRALGMQPKIWTNHREGTHHNALDDAVYQARTASVTLGYLDTLKTTRRALR